MDTRRGFLEAIRESPDDDLHRLAWADWLDDEGQPDRAAFVRAQVHHAHLEDGPQRDALEDEADDLLARHERRWTEGLEEVALDWAWRRGCVEWVSVQADLLPQIEPVLDRHPVRELRLVGNEATYSALRDWEGLARLERLDLGRHAIDTRGPGVPIFRDAAFRPLLASPHLMRLKSLRLSGHEVSGPTAHLLLDQGLVARLERLELDGCHAWGDGATRLLAEQAAPHLEALILRRTNLSEFGIRAALAAPRWPALRALDVTLGRLFRAGISQDRFEADLLRAPLLPRLTVLNLSNCTLDRSTLTSLLHCPRLGPVEELRLHDCNLGAAEIDVLADWSGLANVRSLDLGNNGFRDAGARRLAESPYVSALRELVLHNNGIGGPGIQALANSPALARLRSLNLASNHVGLPGVKALAEGALRPVELWLNNDNLGPPAAHVLTESPAFARLRALHLSANPIRDEGLRVLCGGALRRLRVLHLDRCELHPPHLDHLLDPGALPALRVLSVRDNGITDADRAHLRARLGVGLSG